MLACSLWEGKDDFAIIVLNSREIFKAPYHWLGMTKLNSPRVGPENDGTSLLCADVWPPIFSALAFKCALSAGTFLRYSMLRRRGLQLNIFLNFNINLKKKKRN